MSTQHMQTAGLRQGLRQRHMSLIAIGGVIGAGLFVGSGVVIRAAGPAAILSFLIAGVLVVAVMRMLAELAVAHPALGSFYEYAREALGPRAGFATGWLYWYFWVNVVALEAVAGAKLLQVWLPDVPLWGMSLGLMLLLTATNLASVRSFGEFEYWFSSIKVAAIVVFIIVGVLWVTGAWGGSDPGVANLTARGGFVPNGWVEVLAKAVPAIGFFVGAEIVTIAAAESREPARAVAKAANSVIWRVLLFYVGSIFIVVSILPWDSAGVATPYVSVLQKVGIPGTADIMNAIILTAVLSALNSGLYTSSRMIFALTGHGDAPHGLAKLSGRGVPVRAILLGTTLGYASVVIAYVSPDAVFPFIVNSYGAVALFVYLLIAISQLRLRRRLEAEAPERLRLKMWLYPGLTYATIAGMLAMIVAMGIIADTRESLFVSLLSVAVTLGAYEVRRRRAVVGVSALRVPRPGTQAIRPPA